MPYDANGQWVESIADQIALANNNARLEQERAAAMKAQGLNPDGSAIRAAFDTVAQENGDLKENYQMNIAGLDPSQGPGYSKYQQEATRTGPSVWAGLQKQRNNAAVLANKESAARQAQSGMNAGNMNMAMRGGMSAGARGLAARASSRDALMARQNASRAGDQANLQTDTTDESNRVGQLGNLAAQELQTGQYNKTMEAKQKEFNIQNMLSEQQQKRAYNENTYNKQMDTWAANKQADATARSGGGGGGGCCFIFLEARYGNGTMDTVVRKFRDEKMTIRNKRGYYKLAEVLVPLMRKSKIVKGLVILTMTDPLVAYGKAYYGGNKLGFIFKPVMKFWLGLFDYLGQDHAYIRETGEVV